MKKRLVFLAMHGLGGAGLGGPKTYYPWTPSPLEEAFIAERVAFHENVRDELYEGVFWHSVIQSAMDAESTKKFELVSVICTKGRPFNSDVRFIEEHIAGSMMQGIDVVLIPVAKSLGGFNAIEAVTALKKRFGNHITIPYSLLIDPDDRPLKTAKEVNIIPDTMDFVQVVLQTNPKKVLLKGHFLYRCDGSSRDIKTSVFPEDQRFPKTDPHFANQILCHDTVDEYMAIYGHPETGTIRTQLINWINTL